MPRTLGPGRPSRLPGHDYTACGEYLVTVVVRDRALLFGSVEDDLMRLNAAGEAVRRAWTDLPERFPFVRLDDYIVMPNHVHGILRFVPPEEMEADSPGRDAGRLHLDAVIGVFKSVSTIAVNRALGREGASLWQRGYYEHVVRSETALERIRGYIGGNPEAWPRDRYNPAAGMGTGV